MVRPVLNPGRLLEPVSDCWPRGMTVHDRTRLTGQLHSFRKTPLRRGFCFVRYGLRGMTVHDAFHKRKRLTGQLHSFHKTPLRRGFCFVRYGLRGMTAHDAFHKRKRLTGQRHSSLKTMSWCVPSVFHIEWDT